MMKPKIFVSSTILDFEDLRSAIKYFLEEHGFEVQMSEFPNFDIAHDSSRFDACLKNLEKCQYFVLLIGYRRGSWYEKNKISVTHKEFRTARSLIEKGYKLRIITFVRKPIWLLRSDREALIEHFLTKSEELATEIENTGSSIIDDPKYIFNFIDDVQKGIKLSEQDRPINDWIFDFEGFDDIAVALKNTFNLKGTLDDKKLTKLLIEELNQNLLRFYTPSPIPIEKRIDKNDKSYINIPNYIKEKFYKQIAEIWAEIVIGKRIFLISGSDVSTLHMFLTFFPDMVGTRFVKTTILEKVLNDGLFLRYDPTKHDFETNYITKALEKLFDLIAGFRNFIESSSYDEARKELMQISVDGSAYKTSVDLPTQIARAIAMFAWAADIPELILALLKFFNKGDDSALRKFDFSTEKIFANS